jgi:type III restriction enzyme
VRDAILKLTRAQIAVATGDQKGYFYPDFVAELVDGRVLVIEYKGSHLMGDASRAKAQIGHQWEVTSGGRGLFLMATAPDDDSHRRDVARQIADKIDGG